jgi:hypothetical protein
MPRVAEYRAKAAELRAQARSEPNREVQDQLEKLARGYDHLAEQALKNRHADIVYEPREEFPPSSK